MTQAAHAAPHRESPTLLGAGVLLSRGYLAVAGGLLFWSLVPTVLGLSSVVVRTGSMQPAIRPGDILVAERTSPAAVRPGEVILADNPARPGTLLSHRVVARSPDGGLVTRGDANEASDSTPVEPSQVRGIARLRVPFVGLPAVWWWEGRRGAVLAALAASAAAVLLAGAGTGPGRRRTARHRVTRPPRRSGRHAPRRAARHAARPA